ncbi:shikimate kinase [Herbidospora mongoliensis]|uniref:shikimate kinase n=1 Tax=Herbidospora mongoliensis TaxID=688067 RepID=UPI00082F8FA3|nr:shikimate kinase [Herbidospora mongoliensis]
MPVVVLIGPPGSGKSTVGELLAERLGVGFRDTDLDAEQVAGKPISDIFVEDGEEAFRALEAAAVRTALAEHAGVLALGGGSILDAATRELLAGHTVVYLKVGLDHAIKRVGLASARPLLVLNPRSQMRKLMEERRPLYEGLAVLTVVTDDLEAPEVVDQIQADLTGGPEAHTDPKRAAE